MQRMWRSVCVSLLLAAFSGPAFAQGRVHGRVVAKIFGGLPDVRITVSNATVERTTTTDREGSYSIADLPSGEYRVEASTGAFKDGVRSSVRVQSGDCRVDFTLEPLEPLDKPIVISEPPILTVGQLFRQADVVALVEVVSGDAEHYQPAVYRAKVVAGYKGARSGQTIRFGPYIGREIGTNHVLFLTRTSPPRVTASKGEDGVKPVAEPFYRGMLEGYGSMQVAYVCVFDDQVGSPCGEGVRVGWHVELPESIKLFGGAVGAPIPAAHGSTAGTFNYY
jgi:hypothetical protein